VSYARRLRKGLDLDLIDRVEAGGRPQAVRVAKSRNPPRATATYRGARRNQRRIARAAQLAAKRATKEQR
jgi:hypothetical protein